jgi:hypothetical protein
MSDEKEEPFEVIDDGELEREFRELHEAVLLIRAAREEQRRKEEQKPKAPPPAKPPPRPS